MDYRLKRLFEENPELMEKRKTFITNYQDLFENGIKMRMIHYGTYGVFAQKAFPLGNERIRTNTELMNKINEDIDKQLFKKYGNVSENIVNKKPSILKRLINALS